MWKLENAKMSGVCLQKQSGEKWVVFVSKILLITFKAVHGLAPAYISELISVRETAGRHHLRSNNGLRLNYSQCKSLATLGDRSFHVDAPKLWNDLPSEIRNMSSMQSFKKAIKTFLFLKAF